ncbi:MAG TPA: hypothetical protein GX736_02005 [Mogibacterium sp.]|nr:hypothetical protein [Mogibacterium sp.]
MPLLLIGLILLIGILIYSLFVYIRGEDDERTVRERYPHAFKDKPDYDNDSEDSKTLYFPTDDVEKEKHRRNIH